MKIVLFDGFDCGISIGTDDTHFKKAKADGLEKNALLYPEERLGIVPTFGTGICFSALDWIQDWQADAESVGASPEFHSCMSVKLTDKLSEALKQYPPSDCWVELYSCGIALIVLVIDGIPDNCAAEALSRMAQAYEYAAYGRYGAKNNIQKALLDLRDPLIFYDIGHRKSAFTY